MRSNFTNQDLTNFMEQIFNGNLKMSKIDKNVVYSNPNSEEIVLINEDGEKTEVDLAKYLNIDFYTWKNRVEERQYATQFDENKFYDYIESLDFSLNQAYALVETIDEEITSSQDIDSATKTAQITFLIQANKLSNLDYYIQKLKNKYIGNPEDVQNAYGNLLTTYFSFGYLDYEQDPQATSVGEVIVATCKVAMYYINQAFNYTNTKIYISLSGDNNVSYMQMPIIKATWQDIFTDNAVTRVNRPELTGVRNVSVSSVKTLTFFDLNIDLTNAINRIFWGINAIKINGTEAVTRDINIPVYLKVVFDGSTYIYKDTITHIEKVISNGDINITSMTLKGMGK